MGFLQANLSGFVGSHSSNKTTEALEIKGFCANSASTVLSLNCINDSVFIDPAYHTGKTLNNNQKSLIKQNTYSLQLLEKPHITPPPTVRGTPNLRPLPANGKAGVRA